jgi:hypothetical protein
MTLTTTPLRDAADRLIAAAAAPRQCDPVRDILGKSDIASAYAVQRLLTEHSPLVGGQEDMIGDVALDLLTAAGSPKTSRLGDEPPTSSALP